MDEILKNLLASLRNVLLIVICVGFLGVGMLKMVELPRIKAEFIYWNFPIWSMYLIGLIEICLSIGIFYKPTRINSIFALIALMCGASLVHIIHQETNFILTPLGIIGICLMLLFLEKRLLAQR